MSIHKGACHILPQVVIYFKYVAYHGKYYRIRIFEYRWPFAAGKINAPAAKNLLEVEAVLKFSGVIEKGTGIYKN